MVTKMSKFISLYEAYGCLGIRDFEIFDENEKSIAIATSSWLIMDLKSRRPYKGDDLLNLKLGKGDGFWEESLAKLSSPLNGKLFFEKEAAYSDLDINNHVNNVKYLEWILDGYDFEFIKNNQSVFRSFIKIKSFRHKICL